MYAKTLLPFYNQAMAMTNRSVCHQVEKQINRQDIVLLKILKVNKNML